MTQQNKDKLLFGIYILGFLILALTLALFQPLADTPPMFGNPPDEHARYLIPQYICEHGKIPTGFEEEVRIPTYGFSYGLYNVFPYIVQGYVMRFVSVFTDSGLLLLYSARLVNVLSGALMAVVVYLMSGRLFQDHRFKWLFCFAVMYLPQNLFLHTYVNTDSMCLLSTAMMVYALVRAYQEGFGRKNCLWLCGGIILCALSYYNAYGYILSSILLFLAYFLRREKGRWRYDWKQMLRKGCLISVIVLAGIGWWFVRSYLLYDGDFLGLETRQRMAAQFAEEAVNPLSGNTFQQRGYTIWQMMKEKKFAECVFYSFVAAFGSVSITGGIWLYRFYKVFLGGGLLAFCLLRRKRFEKGTLPDASLAQRRRQDCGMQGNKFGGRTLPDTASLAQRRGQACDIQGEINGGRDGGGEEGQRWKRIFFHANMIFCILMPVVLLIRYAYTMDYQDQGRYLLPAVIPLMYYVTEGFNKLSEAVKISERVKSVLIGLLAAAIAAGAIWMVCFRALPVYLSTGVVLS